MVLDTIIRDFRASVPQYPSVERPLLHGGIVAFVSFVIHYNIDLSFADLGGPGGPGGELTFQPVGRFVPHGPPTLRCST